MSQDNQRTNNTTHKPDLHSLSTDELSRLVTGLGQPAFRARQLQEWLWNKGVVTFDQMTNVPKVLRAELAQRYSLGGVTQVACQTSSDGSRKYLLAFDDGVSVECVGMPSGRRLTVCASTQAGCAMGCAFCATGKAGFTRQLTAAQIVDQVQHVAHDFDRRVTGVVLMGQGEPFANYDATLEALRRLNSKEGLGIGARHLTVSTCGLIPQIRKFSKEPEQFTLAVSLHSAVQSTRDALMPGVKRFSLLRLHDAMADYVERTGRRPSYEYALIKGINDSDAELEALCDFCRGTLAHVNLIPLNDVPSSPFKPADEGRIQRFARALESQGTEATVRVSRGQDIDAACGQLKQAHEAASN